MASAKKERYDKNDVRLAKYAKALAHPARIVILRQLAARSGSFFNELSTELPIADSTVSQHIAELKSAGLIHGIYEPPRIRYVINLEELKRARKLLKSFTKTKIPKNHTHRKV